MLSILSVGQKMPTWVEMAQMEYLKRLQRFFKCQLLEIPTALRSKTADITRIKQEESSKILQKIHSDDWVVVLEVKGESFSTEQLAQKLNLWRKESKAIKFVIGGPDGLDESCLARANVKWSLSPLTFPHALARIIVLEQIYRAGSVLASHPYHRP